LLLLLLNYYPYARVLGELNAGNVDTRDLNCPGGVHLATLYLIVVVIITTVTLFDVSAACYVFPSNRRDPCIGRRCHYGARCSPSADGRKSRCVCPTRCDQFGDAVGSTTVCGSDGHNYASVCELRRTACRQLKNIEKKYDGKCG